MSPCGIPFGHGSVKWKGRSRLASGVGGYAVVGLGFVFFSLSITPFVENERSKKTLMGLVMHLRVILAWVLG